MPGILGIISRRDPQACRRLVSGMAASMRLEPSYESAQFEDAGLGVFAAWTHNAASRSGGHRCESSDGNLVLLLAGEMFPDEGPSTMSGRARSAGASKPGEEWLAAYDRHGDRALAAANGLFSGVLIDRRRRAVLLFNDRYGVERLYVYEAGDALLFASEAKAILAAEPRARAFDQAGLIEHLSFGCTLEDRTLFQGVQTLPAAALWTMRGDTWVKSTYFSPAEWEQQAPLPEGEFAVQLHALLAQIVPHYAASDGPIGVSLTAGLDTRMVMAALLPPPPGMVAFTYSGEKVDPLDARIAAKIADRCGIKHHVLRIGPDFFADFERLAQQTVVATDGCFGVCGAHEIYMSRLARALAPLRLTGNYGGEILRGVSTLKRNGKIRALLSRELQTLPFPASEESNLRAGHPVTFAAFREVPRNLYGNLAAGKSQLGFRTPYLDNAFVKLAFRCPQARRSARNVCIDVVRRGSPDLALIHTDKGYLGKSPAVVDAVRQAWAYATFKIDYYNNEGFPNSLISVEPLFQRTMAGLGVLGLHKHLHYRSWFRDRLHGFVADRLSAAVKASSPIWDPSALKQVMADHLEGRQNRVDEINAILTIQVLQESLLRTPRPDVSAEIGPNRARVSSPAAT